MADSPPRAVLRLMRVQTMALTALVPAFGALVFIAETGEDPWGDPYGTLAHLLPLFVSGCLFHIFGFVLNEWADLEVDRASGALAGKPLVSEAVQPRSALGLAASAALLCFLPMALVTLDPVPYLALALAIALGTFYDLYGKRLPLDLVLAGSLSSLLVAGALASGSFDAESSRHWVLLAGLVGLQFMQNLFQNAIEGGIKDADHDAAAGARTFAALLGVKVGNDGVLVQSWAFIVSGAVIKGAHLVILAWVAISLMDLGGGREDLPLITLLLLMSAGMVVSTTLFLRRRVEFLRPRLKRIFSGHEMITFIATVMLFLPIYGTLAALAFIGLPVLWFVVANTILFGHPLEPGV